MNTDFELSIIPSFCFRKTKPMSGRNTHRIPAQCNKANISVYSSSVANHSIIHQKRMSAVVRTMAIPTIPPALLMTTICRSDADIQISKTSQQLNSFLKQSLFVQSSRYYYFETKNHTDYTTHYESFIKIRINEFHK